MEQFEYEVTRHGPELFQTIVYYCTPEGDCETERVPAKEAQTLLDLFNERGQAGWELTQLLPGDNAVLAFWKRRIVGR